MTERGAASTSRDLKNIVAEARPMIADWLALADKFAGLREAATAKGLDWSQIKALVKAQLQDEEDGGKRVQKIIDKADFAASYADMLGLVPAKMNEFINSPDRGGPSAAHHAVAPSGADVGGSANTQSESRRLSTSDTSLGEPDAAQPEGGRTVGSRPPIHHEGGAVRAADDRMEVRSNDTPNLAAAADRTLPVAVSDPLTDSRGLMIEDMPADLVRAA